MQERVTNGMALLDEKVPDWREKIDLDTLDVRKMTKCVLGQVFDVANYGDLFSS